VSSNVRSNDIEVGIHEKGARRSHKQPHKKHKKKKKTTTKKAATGAAGVTVVSKSCKARPTKQF
jgi:hypothetical protein